MSDRPVDEKGYPVEVGDVIKIYHFTDRRRRKHFMYKVVVRVNDQNTVTDDGKHWYAMSVHTIPKDWELAHKFPLRSETFEIVEGYGPGQCVDWTDRMKVKSS